MIRYAFCLLGSVLLLAAVTYLNFYRQVHRVCADDCFVEIGVPFKFYTVGGFAGVHVFNLGGLLADVGIAAAIALAVGAILWRILRLWPAS